MQRPSELLREAERYDFMRQIFEERLNRNPKPPFEAWFHKDDCHAVGLRLATERLGVGWSYSVEASKQSRAIASFTLVHEILATWKLTKGTYRFDPTLRDALLATPLTGEIPTDIFKRLPEWSVYIETPGYICDGDEIAGFFATLLGHDSHVDLVLTFDSIGGPYSTKMAAIENCLAQQFVCLKSGHTIQSQLRDQIVAAKALLDELNEDFLDDAANLTTTRLATNRKLDTPEDIDRDTEEVTSFIAPLLSLVLYLCADERDIESLDGRQKPDELIRTLPPRSLERPANWMVGARLGKLLQQHAAQQEPQKYEEHDTDGRRAKMRPHIRAAHWQTYWYGPRKEPANRSRRIRWVHVSFVNTRKDTKLPVTVNEALPTTS